MTRLKSESPGDIPPAQGIGSGGGVYSGGAAGSSAAVAGGAGMIPTLRKTSRLPIPDGKPAASLNSGGYLVLIPAAGYISFPAAIVPPGATVRVRAHNGSSTGNTNPVKVIGSFDAAVAATGPGDYLAPDDEAIYPADNLGQIWIRGTAGDGAIASIRAGA